MKDKFLGINLDFLGFSASMLCAIHCAAMPFILTLSALSGLHFLGNHLIEVVMIAIAIIIAVISLYKSYRQIHRKKLALIIVTIGFSIMFLSHFIGYSTVAEFITALGGVMVAMAHIINIRLINRYGNCRVSVQS